MLITCLPLSLVRESVCTRGIHAVQNESHVCIELGEGSTLATAACTDLRVQGVTSAVPLNAALQSFQVYSLD